jgi:hypothetical protein
MGARCECAVVVWRSGGEGSGPRERLSLVRLGRLEGALGGPCHIVISHLAPALTLLAESGVAVAI